MNLSYRPEGWQTVTPRIVVADPEGLVDFIKAVFGATGHFHTERPTELRIDESIIMISPTSERDETTALLYVYVPDTDATFLRAMEAGASSIEEPHDAPYGDRRAMIADAWGNHWQIATHSGRFTV